MPWRFTILQPSQRRICSKRSVWGLDRLGKCQKQLWLEHLCALKNKSCLKKKHLRNTTHILSLYIFIYFYIFLQLKMKPSFFLVFFGRPHFDFTNSVLFVGKFQQPHTHRKFSSHREAETHDEFPQTSGVFSGMMAQNESSKMPIQTGKSRIPEFCGGDIHVALTGHAICIYIYILYTSLEPKWPLF